MIFKQFFPVRSLSYPVEVDAHCVPASGRLSDAAQEAPAQVLDVVGFAESDDVAQGGVALGGLVVDQVGFR